MRTHKIALFGVPCAAGGRTPGIASAPRALREAGLVGALSDAGAEVTDLGDLPEAPWTPGDDAPQFRKTDAVAAAARGASERTAEALRQGFALILGGDCTLVTGTVDGAWKALGEPVGLIYLDADADLNTPETTPSGFLNGMALALALGEGPESGRAGAPVSGDHVSLVGYRALDAGERDRLGDLGLALPAQAARKLGMRTTAALALDGVGNGDGPILVHLDVDVIDPAEMPAKDPVTGGEALSLEEASDLVTALLASPRVVGLQLVELDAASPNASRCAKALVELLARAVARRLRSRTT